MDSESGGWTVKVEGGQWEWRMDSGQWRVGSGRWTVEGG